MAKASLDVLSIAARLHRIRGQNRVGNKTLAKKLAELLGVEMSKSYSPEQAGEILRQALNLIGATEGWHYDKV